MKKYFKKLSLALSVCALSIITFPSIAGNLDCGNNLKEGTHTGRLVKLINKDGWTRTNYQFVGEGVSGCVQVDERNTTRTKIIYNAFFLGKEVTIYVSNTADHFIDGISVAN